MPIVPVLQASLPHSLQPGLVTAGKLFNGKRQAIACAAPAGKVVIISVTADGVGIESTVLSFDRDITAIAAGQLKSDKITDILLVASASDLTAYDVANNATVFFKETPDGATAVTVGRIADRKLPIAIAGGHCSIVGFDADGNDAFWTVTGDTVQSLVICDLPDCNRALIVGSDDFDIRIFNDDELIHEISETERVTNICALGKYRYAYSLSNGTVGVYESNIRLWRIKSKNQAVALTAFDFDSDGNLELIIGWSCGKIDARNSIDGTMVFKDKFNNSSVSGLVAADLRGDGKALLIAVSDRGELRAFEPVPEYLRSELLATVSAADSGSSSSSSSSSSSTPAAPAAVHNLMQNRAQLEQELQSLQSSSTSSKTMSGSSAIASDTELKSEIRIASSKSGDKQLQLHLQVTRGAVLRAAVLQAEGIFAAECHVAHPPLQAVGHSLTVPFMPLRNAQVELHFKCLVADKTNSKQFHVFEVTRTLPKFCAFAPDDNAPLTDGFVRFRIQERSSRIELWLEKNFILPSTQVNNNSNNSNSKRQRWSFTSLQSGDGLHFELDNGRMTIGCDDMELCGDLISSLAEFLGLQELTAEAQFPQLQQQQLQQMSESILSAESAGSRIIGDVAEAAGIVRSLIVRAEDARMLGDFSTVHRAYSDLSRINSELAAAHLHRSNVQQQLSISVKELNSLIQRAARLRIGRPRAQIIAECRAAVSEENYEILHRILCNGAA